MTGETNGIPEDKGNHVRQLRTNVLFGGDAPSRMIPLGQSRRPGIIFTDGFCVSVPGGNTGFGAVIFDHAMQHTRMKTSSIKNSPEILLEDQRTVGAEQILGQADVLAVAAAKELWKKHLKCRGCSVRSCVRGQRCRKIRLDPGLQPVTNIWVACLGGNSASPPMDLSFNVSSSSPVLLFFFVSSSTSSRDLFSVAMPKLPMPTTTDVHCCTCTQHVLLPIVLGSVGSVKNMSGARLLCWCFLSSSVQQRRRVFVFCFHWVPPLSVRLLPH